MIQNKMTGFEWNCWILLGVLLSLVLTVVFKLTYKIDTKESKLKRIWAIIKEIFTLLLSVDFCISKWQKGQIKKKYQKVEQAETKEDDKKEKELAEYIKRNNRNNLLVSIFAVIVLTALMYIVKEKWFVYIAIGMSAYRILSRTMEVNMAFCIDVTSNENNSKLNKHERIKLALYSLLEEAILFTGLFLLFNNTFDVTYISYCIINGCSSFLPSINSCENIWFAIIKTYQSICGFLLISLSIASYISRNEKDS